MQSTNVEIKVIGKKFCVCRKMVWQKNQYQTWNGLWFLIPKVGFSRRLVCTRKKFAMCKCSFAAKKLQLFPLYEETSHIFQPLMSHFSFSYSLIDSLSSRDPLIKVTKLHQPFFESFDVLRHAFRRFKMQQIMMNNLFLGHTLWGQVMGPSPGQCNNMLYNSWKNFSPYWNIPWVENFSVFLTIVQHIIE